MLLNINVKEPVTLHEGLYKGQDLKSFLDMDLPSTFLFVMKSDAMAQALIFKGDVVLCRKDIIPDSGDIVVAVLNGKFIMRYLYNEPYPMLKSADDKDIIDLRFNRSCYLVGVVSGLMRKLKKISKF